MLALLCKGRFELLGHLFPLRVPDGPSELLQLKLVADRTDMVTVWVGHPVFDQSPVQGQLSLEHVSDFFPVVSHDSLKLL